MKKITYIAFLFAICAGILIGADLLNVNKSTVYKVESGALYTTTLNQLQVITKHCVTINTRIYLDDKPVDLRALKPGFKVIVQYKGDLCKTAVIIKAYSH
jgi:hypothetical protein